MAVGFIPKRFVIGLLGFKSDAFGGSEVSGSPVSLWIFGLDSNVGVGAELTSNVGDGLTEKVGCLGVGGSKDGGSLDVGGSKDDVGCLNVGGSNVGVGSLLNMLLISDIGLDVNTADGGEAGVGAEEPRQK